MLITLALLKRVEPLRHKNYRSLRGNTRTSLTTLTLHRRELAIPFHPLAAFAGSNLLTTFPITKG